MIWICQIRGCPWGRCQGWTSRRLAYCPWFWVYPAWRRFGGWVFLRKDRQHRYRACWRWRRPYPPCRPWWLHCHSWGRWSRIVGPFPWRERPPCGRRIRLSWRLQLRCWRGRVWPYRGWHRIAFNDISTLNMTSFFYITYLHQYPNLSRTAQLK